jgi:uncharacterized protein (TIGR00730 family)
VTASEPEGIGSLETLAAALDGLTSPRDRQLADRLVDSLSQLLETHPATIDLKITSASLAEMGEAFTMFAPYRHLPKVTVFGSARTQAHDVLYDQARAVSKAIADAGWMVVTGAGPGIMHAAMEGAGRDRSFGVSIRLPFEQGANPVIAGDPKYVSMRYFFTRKLMLVKESKGFICLPGGFGTLDETFELLTLTQTGKGVPVPIVLLDAPGDPYWETVHDFIEQQLVRRGLVSPADTNLYLVADDPQRAVDEIIGFYANYDSMRMVDDHLVVRVRQPVTDEQLELLNERFAPLCSRGTIERIDATPDERRDDDLLHLNRIGFEFGRRGYGGLRSLIDALNEFVA